MYRSLPSCRWFVVALVLLASPFAIAQQRSSASAPIEQRVALVIGNSSYKESPLKNPVNDAADITAALRELGFRVVLRTNANRRQMVEAVREFGSLLKKGGVGLFYFAGHGVQSRGRNYLVPLGAAVEAEADLEFEAMDANMVLAQMDEAGNRVNIVVLDACRNNPFARSFRSASRGLAQMDAATGSFLAYATAPGSVAADGDGRNGIFTKHLLASLKNPESKVEDVFKRVRVEVARETGNKQIPWDSSSLTGDFYFRATADAAQSAGNGAVTSAAPTAVVAPPVQVAMVSRNVDAIGYVNGRPIPKSVFDFVVKANLAKEQDTPELHSRVREVLIRNELLVQEAAKVGIGAAPDPAKIEKPIDAQIYINTTEAIVNAFIADFVKNLPTTDDAVRAEYDRAKAQAGDREYKLRHILVRSESEAKQIIQQLLHGSNFDNLAAQKSQDPGSKNKGGDLGWAPAGRYVLPFGNAVKKLKSGQTTDAPVQTQFGWHVIRLDDERAMRFPPIEEVKTQIQQGLQRKAIEKLIADLRAQANIE